MDGDRLKALNTEIMLRLQEEGIAAVSDTTVRGRHCLRVAINNHRTRSDDLQLLVRETVRLGDEIAGGDGVGPPLRSAARRAKSVRASQLRLHFRRQRSSMIRR